MSGDSGHWRTVGGDGAVSLKQDQLEMLPEGELGVGDGARAG